MIDIDLLDDLGMDLFYYEWILLPQLRLAQFCMDSRTATSVSNQAKATLNSNAGRANTHSDK